MSRCIIVWLFTVVWLNVRWARHVRVAINLLWQLVTGSRGHPLNNSHRSLWAWWLTGMLNHLHAKKKSNSVFRHSTSEPSPESVFPLRSQVLLHWDCEVQVWFRHMVCKSDSEDPPVTSRRLFLFFVFFFYLPPPLLTVKYLLYLLTTPTADRRIQTTELQPLGQITATRRPPVCY